jgi:hypothetical protein
MQPDHKDQTKQGEAPADDTPAAGGAQHWEPDAEAGLAREVGDLEDPDADEDGALPGRAGGGLAGG